MRETMFCSVLFLLFGCGPTDPVEVCDDGLDNDFDELVDCIDPDCIGSCPELCADEIDNDGDGAVDCYDEDCDGVCDETCDDGRDNDGDGNTDCEDTECFNDMCPENCGVDGTGDGYDNDGDGLTDCGDPDCAADTCQEVCDDLVDNDGDGDMDCMDVDCDGTGFCPEDCADGRDNDGDGIADCGDPDCDGDCPEDCADLRDNDNDGRTDCEDDECYDICDFDRDGYLAAAVVPEGFKNADCDDTNPNVNPGEREVCNEGIDDNCNGVADNFDPGVDPTTMGVFFQDSDGDGYGAPGTEETRCAGDGAAPLGGDCADGLWEVNPGASEICDGIDNDCDDDVDDEDASVDETTATTWYQDNDGDGFGGGDGIYSCNPPAGYVDEGSDCDDDDDGVFGPGQWVEDTDGDGFGTGEPTGEEVCYPPMAGVVSEYLREDCDDSDDSIYPSAWEICEDGIDQDCDDEDLPCITYLYTINTSTNNLEVFDVSTESLSVVGYIGFDLDFGDLAYDRSTDTMYLVEARPEERLHIIDPQTGATSLVGEHGIEDMFGAGFHPPSGTLYGSGETPNGWYRINTGTATATVLGDPDESLSDIAWDPFEEFFVGYEGLSGVLYSLDLTTGAATDLAYLTFVNNGGLEVDPLTGMYWIFDLSGSVYRVDPSDGYSRTTVTTGSGAHDGLSVGPQPD